MHTESSPSTAVSPWESGRLALRAPGSPFVFGRNQMIGAALLLLAAIVFGFYVRVLERDVHRAQALRDQQQANAVAEAQCETATPGISPDACMARYNAATLATAAAPAEGVYAEDGASRSFTLSTASVSGLPVGAQ